MIVDQVSEVINLVPEEELLSVAKTASMQPSSNFIKNQRKTATEDFDMVQAESNKKQANPDAYMTNSRMMRDQLILPQPPDKQTNSHSRYLKVQRERQQSWMD